MLDREHPWSQSVKPIVFGGITSLMLILGAFALVLRPILTGWSFKGVLLVLGSVQALIQLVFFLQLGIETRPRWNLIMFFFMALMVVIVVVGSLWIMAHLNYNMMLHS